MVRSRPGLRLNAVLLIQTQASLVDSKASTDFIFRWWFSAFRFDSAVPKDLPPISVSSFQADPVYLCSFQ